MNDGVYPTNIRETQLARNQLLFQSGTVDPYIKTLSFTDSGIYSLGLVLYRLSNRRRLPFYPMNSKKISHTDKEEALNKRMDGYTLPIPCEASSEFAKIILKACAYDPNERWQSAKEMKNALEKLKERKRNQKNSRGDYLTDTESEQADDTIGIYEKGNKVNSGIYQNSEEVTIRGIDTGYKKQGGDHTDSGERVTTSTTQGTSGNNSEQEPTKNGLGNPKKLTENDDLTHTNDENPKPKKINPFTLITAITFGVAVAIVIYSLLPKTYKVTILKGSGSGDYKQGETVYIAAYKTPKEMGDYKFSGWVVVEGDIDLKDETAPNTSFVMGKKPVTIYGRDLKTTYKLTVVSGTIHGTEGQSSGSFYEGDNILLEPKEKEGYIFSRWILSDKSVATEMYGNAIYFKMPNKGLRATAFYNKADY